MSAQHSVSVAAVIIDDRGRVLLTQRRDNGHWEAPGGVLELEESVIDGLKREVLEETGLTVNPIRLTGVYKNMNRAVVALVFLARSVSGAPGVTEEALHIEWLMPDEAAARMDPAYAVRVMDALEQSGPSVRSHDGVSVLHGLPELP